ncbi:60S ribosomal protein L7 [Pycnococcus provasolii]|uniref:60S ribosomal protein L7 n=2 Tax=Pycnococcus provasolii TaxID=41880 RepID=A0A830HMQ3_9CHLO|nr:60S ribosomal protein L7 [Pycnococcus provasolii]
MADAQVPESLLKKRKRNDAWAAAKAAEADKAKKDHKAKRAAMFKRAEAYVKEYREKERDIVRLRREARAKGSFYMEPGAKVLFVMRIRGACDLHPKTRTILKLLRLRQIHNGVFLRVNKPVLNMLKKVEPYITYGYPNLKTIKELIYKRGYGKVNGQRIPLTDNAVIEKVLGEQGIVCVEDLIHEIATAGPNFKQAANFLWPFKLSSPKGGYDVKRKHFIEGGQAGNREEAISSFIKKMC